MDSTDTVTGRALSRRKIPVVTAAGDEEELAVAEPEVEELAAAAREDLMLRTVLAVSHKEALLWKPERQTVARLRYRLWALAVEAAHSRRDQQGAEQEDRMGSPRLEERPRY